MADVRSTPTPTTFLGAKLALAVALAALGGLVPHSPLSGQDTVPPPPQPDIPVDLATVELARSSGCVSVLADIENLNLQLQPLGTRAERLGVIMQAILLEDRRIMEELDQDDSIEAAVHAWFVADGRLAQSFVDTGNEDLQRQRTIGREQIKGTVQTAIEAQQEEAQALVEATGNLGEMAGACDGAIFIRSAVIEACADQQSPVCGKAMAEEPDSALPYRFVEAAADLWGVEEIRPWASPQGLQIAADGSVGGATTFALARRGNVALSVGFSPLIRERAELDDSVALVIDEILDSLAIEFDHPDVVFAPALSVRATLPEALGGEDRYILHFGPSDNADVVWAGPAGTGRVLEDLVVLDPRHVNALVSGTGLTLTAISGEIDGEEPAQVLFELPLTIANQTSATGALLGYMGQQLPSELARLFSGGGSSREDG